MANFSHVAPMYDAMARLVFGDELMQATKAGFSYILPGDQVLIMGGGTGKVLEALDELNIPLQVLFLDSSQAMIELAGKRRMENIEVEFICADARAYSHNRTYDIVLTPFFLDCFSTKELLTQKDDWEGLLKPDGHWLFIDFIPTDSRWKNSFIGLMYRFFRITASLHLSSTPDYDQFFEGMKLIQSSRFFKDMIDSRVYTKS